jgi:hypothetical protein
MVHGQRLYALPGGQGRRRDHGSDGIREEGRDHPQHQLRRDLRAEDGQRRITFRARFNGVSRELYIPVQNVLAIYANENGQGMAFDVSTTAAEPAPARKSPRRRPSLAAVPRRPPFRGKPAAAAENRGVASPTTMPSPRKKAAARR